MIHIISPYPYIEKQAIGRFVNGEFFGEKFNTGISGAAFITNDYLNYNDVLIYGLIGKDALKYLPKKFKYLEVDNRTPYVVAMISDVKEKVLHDHYQYENENAIKIFAKVCLNEIKDNDIVSLIADDYLSNENFEVLYRGINPNTKRLVYCLPRHYEVLRNNPCDVLVVNSKDLKDVYINIDDVIDYVENNCLDVARIVIVSLHSNSILLFIDNQVYLATHQVKDERNDNYPLAVMAAIIKCAKERTDQDALLIDAITLSVGSSLSFGRLKVNEESKRQIRQKIVITKIR